MAKAHNTSRQGHPAPTWGGAREGAGRKKTSPFVSHLKRPKIEGRKFPVLITSRLRSQLPSLCDQEVFSVFHKAALRARRFGLRILEYRVEPNKLKLLCEFKTGEQLERSLKSLNTSLAIVIKKRVQAASGSPHAGPVFLGRFMMEEINDPRRFKNILRELLLVDPDSAKPEALTGPWSSAPLFTKWRDLLSEGKRSKPSLLMNSGKSLSAQLTHLDDQKIIRDITASPQFRFSKDALRALS